MKDSEYFKFDLWTVAPAFVFIFVMWLVYWVEVKFHFRFTDNGIKPLHISGLQGVLFSPFIHGNLKHLWSNTLPCLLLITALNYFYRRISFRVLILGLLFSGLLTWFIGRPSYHIGASGVVYMLASFLFFKGIVTRHYKMISLSFIVTFFYGSLIWYVLPIEDGISWEGHLSGGTTGLILAVFTRSKLPQHQIFEWQQEHYNEEDDPFMRHFDEQGNFIEFTDVDDEQE